MTNYYSCINLKCEICEVFPAAYHFSIHLDIELNSTCNLRCIKCYHSFDKPEPKEMPIDLVKKIIDEGVEKELASIKTINSQ